MNTYSQNLRRSGVTGLVIRSVLNFGGMVVSSSLHLRHGRLQKKYVAQDGQAYTVFRETVASTLSVTRTSSVLVVGFRPKLLRSSGVLHWTFQRLGILTTPFWSGFRGFGVKLWMVDEAKKNYLGVYQWGESELAERYVDALVRVLRPLSRDGSVWYHLYPNTKLGAFLATREYRGRVRRA